MEEENTPNDIHLEPLDTPAHEQQHCPYFDANGHPRFNVPHPVQTPPAKTFMHHFGQICMFFLILGILSIVGFCALIGYCISEYDSSGSTNDNGDVNLAKQLIYASDNDQTIAVINIKGEIGEAPMQQGVVSASNITTILRGLEKDNNIKALILDMNTPGGEVTASDEIYHAIKQFKAKKKIPVITCMHAMGASGGYYIAAATDYIIANHSTFTGSIGVILSTYNATGLSQKIGVTVETYCSGNMKDMLNPARPRTQKEILYVNSMIQESFDIFTQIVAEGRPKYFKSAAAVKRAYFADGRVLSGIEAKKVGLIDELGYMETAYSKAKELANLKNPKIIRYGISYHWYELLNMSAERIIPKASQLMPVKAATLQAGKLYYIAPQAVAQ